MTDSTHEQQLQQLIDATTDLTESVNVNKRVLDSAVDSATGSAQSAANASNIAVNAKEEAKTAASEAKEAEANATAIVHNDEGSVTPGAGKYPVADSKGHLDIGWTPLLQAMYPYSGVIGSVDKGDIIFTYSENPSPLYVNIFFLEPNISFNIAGRLVTTKPSGGTSKLQILLPEAEYTADRAIAFDDIFLDWNGQVQTYRSITPHRTVTGYDRDAIATEHGYSKIQTGLYKTGDTYALLLGRVARRNKGAYHPEFNPEGTRRLNEQHTGYWANSFWFTDKKYIPSNLEGYFQITTGDPEKGEDYGAFVNSGNISSGASRQGRPDQKPYDAIYADDFTPLYYSAKNVVDRQALLFDSFNRAVAGETFSGAEGTANKYKSGKILPSSSSVFYISGRQDAPFYDEGVYENSRFLFKVNSIPDGMSLSDDVPITTWIKGKVILHSNGVNWMLVPEDREPSNMNVFSGGVAPDIDISINHFNSSKESARPQFLMVDIIGALDAMPPEWLEHGLPGNWLATDEDGNSLIPDGTQKNYKLSRKCLECYQVLSTTDKGVTWTDNSALRGHFEGASNSMSHNPSAATCYMVFYRTSANPFELADNDEVASLGEVFVTNSHALYEGSALMTSLTGKVPTNATGRLLASPYLMTKAVRIRKLVSDQWSSPLEHYPPELSLKPDPTTKVLPYLAEDGHMHCIYKELKNNGTSWGDDNKFDIVNKQSTVTDLNGESVVCGQKRVELPYQFSGEQL